MCPVWLNIDKWSIKHEVGDIDEGNIKWEVGVEFVNGSVRVEEGVKIASILLKFENGDRQVVEETAPASGFMVPLSSLTFPFVSVSKSELKWFGNPIALISDRLRFSGRIEYEIVKPERFLLGRITPWKEYARFRRVQDEGVLDTANIGSKGIIWGRMERDGKVVKELHKDRAFDTEAIYYVLEDGERITSDVGRRGAVFLEILDDVTKLEELEVVSGIEVPDDYSRESEGGNESGDVEVKGDGKEDHVLEKESAKDSDNESEEDGGYVYILGNRKIPDIIKIDSAKRNPKGWTEEISAPTGEPIRFKLIYKKEVKNPSEKAKELRKKLLKNRISGEVKFFRISKVEAVETLESLCKEKKDIDQIYEKEEEKIELKETKEMNEEKKDKSGFIYVLNNPEIPNLLKIGSTKRDPEERAKELSSPTGVPVPFEVVYKKEVESPKREEMRVHREFSKERVSVKREFFKIDKREAINTIEKLVSE